MTLDPKLLQVPTFMRRERIRVTKRRIAATALDRKLAKSRTCKPRISIQKAPVVVRVEKLVKPKLRTIRTAKVVRPVKLIKKPKLKKLVAPKKPVKKNKPLIKKTAKPTVSKKIEKPIAEITHFYDKIKVAVLKVYSPIKEGDVIRIVGAQGDFKQPVKSMQIDHQTVQIAKKGADVGLKLSKSAKPGDKVYLV